MLNKARDDAGKLAQNSLHDTNNVVRMVTAGSKGSFINISQVCPIATLQVHGRALTLQNSPGVPKGYRSFSLSARRLPWVHWSFLPE